MYSDPTSPKSIGEALSPPPILQKKPWRPNISKLSRSHHWMMAAYSGLGLLALGWAS